MDREEREREREDKKTIFNIMSNRRRVSEQILILSSVAHTLYVLHFNRNH